MIRIAFILYDVFLVGAEFNELNPLNANPTKWSNTLKQFVGNLLTNCLSVFDLFVGLALEELKNHIITTTAVTTLIITVETGISLD